jgi:hypothetical protein
MLPRLRSGHADTFQEPNTAASSIKLRIVFASAVSQEISWGKPASIDLDAAILVHDFENGGVEGQDTVYRRSGGEQQTSLAELP